MITRSGPAVPWMDDHGNHHAASVDAWLRRCVKEAGQQGLLPLFNAALAVLWRRTATTLGEVTLTAIADRVVHNAAEKFPFFVSLTVEPGRGIRCGELRGRSGPPKDAELRAGVRFALVELLTVLGNLTAEILTEELHAELATVTVRSVRTVPMKKKKKKSHPGEGQRS